MSYGKSDVKPVHMAQDKLFYRCPSTVPETYAVTSESFLENNPASTTAFLAHPLMKASDSSYRETLMEADCEIG